MELTRHRRNFGMKSYRLESNLSPSLHGALARFHSRAAPSRNTTIKLCRFLFSRDRNQANTGMLNNSSQSPGNRRPTKPITSNSNPNAAQNAALACNDHAGRSRHRIIFFPFGYSSATVVNRRYAHGLPSTSTSYPLQPVSDLLGQPCLSSRSNMPVTNLIRPMPPK